MPYADKASDGKLEVGYKAFRRRRNRRSQKIEPRPFERCEGFPQLRIVGAGGSKLLLRPREIGLGSDHGGIGLVHRSFRLVILGLGIDAALNKFHGADGLDLDVFANRLGLHHPSLGGIDGRRRSADRLAHPRKLGFRLGHGQFVLTWIDAKQHLAGRDAAVVGDTHFDDPPGDFRRYADDIGADRRLRGRRRAPLHEDRNREQQARQQQHPQRDPAQRVLLFRGRVCRTGALYGRALIG